MREHFETAIDNIGSFGDTDIFPFPVENFVLRDCKSAVLDLLDKIHRDFDRQLATYPPNNADTLASVGHTGFRWATQIDPIWNAYLLGLIVHIGPSIEASRIPVEAAKVFSYRFQHDVDSHAIFRRDIGYPEFWEVSARRARDFQYVLRCDISDFYSRIYHHRLENALLQLNLSDNIPRRILALLTRFSGNRSYGLPIGGPSARVLAELLLNQIDRLLTDDGIQFCRFVDDYHIFADSREDAYEKLLFLSDALMRNEGLALQKTKTEILTAKDFLSREAFLGRDQGIPSPDSSQVSEFMSIRVRFDPYSATATDDYETLRNELDQFDIVGMLQRELAKSQIHVTLSKRLLRALRFLEPSVKNSAALTLLANTDVLYPIYAVVLMTLRAIISELAPDTRETVCAHVRQLITNDNYITKVELNTAYAVRVLAAHQAPENQAILARLYRSRTSPLVRRDIILTMAQWHNWPWISDLRNSFRTLGTWERRAFLIASYILDDEGKHWRRHVRNEFSPFERIVSDWASQRCNRTNFPSLL